MEQPNPNTAEKLVRVHRAANEWEGDIVVGYLQARGIDATLRTPTELPPLDGAEEWSGSGQVNGVFVLEHQAAAARQALQEFLTTATDERVLEEEAARKLQLDRATIARLRSALREERQTFAFLGWVAVVFLAAAAVLWAIWPAWLKISPPPLVVRWLGVAALVVATACAGNRLARQSKD